MLLNIYLGTTAINWITVFIYGTACDRKLKRKGYKYVEDKKTFSEKIADYVSTAFKLSIPVYNIINATVILCRGDKNYKIMEKQLLKEGKIYIPDGEAFINNKKTITSHESLEKSNYEKAYDEIILENHIVEESVNNNYIKEPQGLILKRTLNPKK